MQLENIFVTHISAARVWEYLRQVDDVVTCVPGAQIIEHVSDDEYLGEITVSVGPMTVNLEGTVAIDEWDNEDRKLTFTGAAKESKGRGSTKARVALHVEDAGDGKSKVYVYSDVTITGKIAQFGRGVIKDVAQQLVEEFSHNLEKRLSGAGMIGDTTEERGDPSPVSKQSSDYEKPLSITSDRIMLNAARRASEKAIGENDRYILIACGVAVSIAIVFIWSNRRSQGSMVL